MSSEGAPLTQAERRELDILRKKQRELDRDLLGIYVDGDIKIRVVRAKFFNREQEKDNFTVGLKGFGKDTMFGAKKFLALMTYARQIEDFFLEVGQITEEDLARIYPEEE